MLLYTIHFQILIVQELTMVNLWYFMISKCLFYHLLIRIKALGYDKCYQIPAIIMQRDTRCIECSRYLFVPWTAVAEWLWIVHFMHQSPVLKARGTPQRSVFVPLRRVLVVTHGIVNDGTQSSQWHSSELRSQPQETLWNVTPMAERAAHEP